VRGCEEVELEKSDGHSAASNSRRTGGKGRDRTRSNRKWKNWSVKEDFPTFFFFFFFFFPFFSSFALPIIQALLSDPTPYCALVLAPTHELAFQIAEQFDALGTVVGLKTCVIVGGVDATQQALVLARKPHVIVATPGRILHHLETTKG
jgi:hypothetical protein